MAKPNHFQLHGDGISVTYYPDGSGPVTPTGRAMLAYQQGTQSRVFSSDEVTRSSVDALGTIVTVRLSILVDFGSVTFSLVVPDVNLDDDAGVTSTSVDTIAITKTSSSWFVGTARHQTSYGVAHLGGTANLIVTPLVVATPL